MHLSRRGSMSGMETQSNAYATISKLPMAPSSRRYKLPNYCNLLVKGLYVRPISLISYLLLT